ncbi:MAG: hypothetical protein ED859_05610 [Desulfuromonadales bacterium]|nr:MAG: hypothetical protein ED859_05610 [Desulfuromonadales bacterium]
MRKTILIAVAAVSGLLLPALPVFSPARAQSPGTVGTKPAAPATGNGQAAGKSAPGEAALPEMKRQQLAAREAALAIKEQELKNLAATLDARVKELEAAKAGIDRSLDARKKVQSANYQKLLKVYKGLKPDEAVKLLDRMDEGEALELLSEMDQKRAAKLLPLIKQERALKWTRQNLAAK